MEIIITGIGVASGLLAIFAAEAYFEHKRLAKRSTVMRANSAKAQEALDSKYGGLAKGVVNNYNSKGGL